MPWWMPITCRLMSHSGAILTTADCMAERASVQGKGGRLVGRGWELGIDGSTWQASITLKHTGSPACHTAEQKLACTRSLAPQPTAAHLQAVEPVGSEAGLPPNLAKRRGGPGGGGGRIQAGAPAGRRWGGARSVARRRSVWWQAGAARCTSHHSQLSTPPARQHPAS